MEHYFTNNPTSKSEERVISYELNGKKFSFISDNGVFSKNHVDFATDFLLQTVCDEVAGDILDVGCGYGVIGITLSYSEKVARVTMLDINQRALELAKKNTQMNHCKNVQIIESNGFEQVHEVYDTIVTNPPIRAGKEVIYQMYKEAKDHLKQGGKLFLVINKKHGAPSTIRYLTELYGNCEIVDKKAGFHVLKCINE
jgi:16S rRNA (guanine1207-N2)-methyltransferase